MDENIKEKVDVEILEKEEVKPIEDIEQTPEVEEVPQDIIDEEKETKEEQPKPSCKQEDGSPKKGSIIWTILLVVVMVGLLILSIVLNRCNSNNSSSSSSSMDYTAYIEKSNEYKSKLFGIANDFSDSTYGKDTYEDFNKIYGYSYDESDKANAKLFYTVGNETKIAVVTIEGFDRSAGEDYETILSSATFATLTKAVSVTYFDINTTFKVDFSADEDFMTLFNGNDQSITHVVADTATPGDYLLAYSFYAKDDNTLCSVNNYIINSTDKPFTHKNGLVTEFEKSKEQLVYFMFM